MSGVVSHSSLRITDVARLQKSQRMLLLLVAEQREEGVRANDRDARVLPQVKQVVVRTHQRLWGLIRPHTRHSGETIQTSLYKAFLPDFDVKLPLDVVE